MRAATTAAARPTPQPMSIAMRKPFWEASGKPPKSVVILARTTPITAAAKDVPIERIRALKLFADAVSDWGTALMMSAGIAPYAKPTPELQTRVTISRLHGESAPISGTDRP